MNPDGQVISMSAVLDGPRHQYGCGGSSYLRHPECLLESLQDLGLVDHGNMERWQERCAEGLGPLNL